VSELSAARVEERGMRSSALNEWVNVSERRREFFSISGARLPPGSTWGGRPWAGLIRVELRARWLTGAPLGGSGPYSGPTAGHLVSQLGVAVAPPGPRARALFLPFPRGLCFPKKYASHVHVVYMYMCTCTFTCTYVLKYMYMFTRVPESDGYPIKHSQFQVHHLDFPGIRLAGLIGP